MVVCAAGAWSTRLGEMLGVHLPVEAVRRQIGFTPGEAGLPTVPFTLDLSTTLYFHNYRDGLLLGIFRRGRGPGFLPRVHATAGPALRPAPLRWSRRPWSGGRSVGGWAGLYENTPDHNAMIGKGCGVPGVLYATGFSGHGFLQAPAVGEIVRDLYLGREPFMDPTPFSADRFADSAPCCARSTSSELAPILREGRPPMVTATVADRHRLAGDLRAEFALRLAELYGTRGARVSTPWSTYRGR